MAGPGDMRVIEMSRFGGPEVLLAARRPIPAPGRREVLVRVEAAGVNPVDVVTRTGQAYLKDLPIVLGWDVAGTVESIGEQVTTRSVGDRVFGTVAFPLQGNGYAQFVCAQEDHLAVIPPGVPAADAAAVAMPALTSWQVLTGPLAVGHGTRLLVTGASGAVGRAAVQIGAESGALVTAVASRDRLPDVPSPGGVELLTAKEDLPALTATFDAIFDPVRALPEEWVLEHVVGDGRVIAFGRQLRRVADRGIATGSLLVDADRGGIDRVSRLLARGVLTPVAAQSYPLEDAVLAHRDLADRQVAKAVLMP